MSNIKFCPNCGEKKLSGEQKFCHNCGNKFIFQEINENKDNIFKKDVKKEKNLPVPPPEILNLRSDKKIDVKIPDSIKTFIASNNSENIKEYSAEDKVEEYQNEKVISFPKLSGRLETMKKQIRSVENVDEKKILEREIDFMECMIEALSQPPAIIIRKDDDIESDVEEIFEGLMKNNKRFFEPGEAENLKETIRHSLKSKKEAKQ